MASRRLGAVELVRGVPITRFYDETCLSTTDRLQLFIQVCQTIQHAHQKGTVHRDIKPSNVLVTLHDNVAVPMVIDFGIAKATQGRLTDQTMFTAFEQFLGTPVYMSPSSAIFLRRSVCTDHRSDATELSAAVAACASEEPAGDQASVRRRSSVGSWV